MYIPLALHLFIYCVFIFNNVTMYVCILGLEFRLWIKVLHDGLHVLGLRNESPNLRGMSL